MIYIYFATLIYINSHYDKKGDTAIPIIRPNKNIILNSIQSMITLLDYKYYLALQEWVIFV